MKYLVTILLVLFCCTAHAQISQAGCNLSTILAQTNQYCSSNGEYSTTNGYKYFEFTATGTDVDITITGASTGTKIINPIVTLFTDCNGTSVIGGTNNTQNGTLTYYKGGLVIGNPYYIQISDSTFTDGAFTICVNNYSPAVTTGQDCFSANFLCTTNTIIQHNVVGAGLYDNEAKGSCIDGGNVASESNSIWYKWKAANNGTLVYTVIPESTQDDIDWVLYDLDTTGDCANVTPANVIRCKAGYGINNSTCPQEAVYYKSGLDFLATDVSEAAGCGQGQDGKLMYLTMQKGHIYGLILNNYSSSGNGFTLTFTDQNNKAGTGTFVSPTASLSYAEQANCTANAQFTFTNGSLNADSLLWNFGAGASIPTATGPGPYTITYSTSGVKSVSITAFSRGGCIDVDQKTITVDEKPASPAIKINNTSFCIGDTVKLTTPSNADYTYTWTGPNNYQSTAATAVIPVTGNEVAGYYKLTVSAFGCTSDADSIMVNTPVIGPMVAFHTDPPPTTVVPHGPVTINFINDSQNADSYYWDFDDGSSSTIVNPTHTYNKKGIFSVKLTGYKNNLCVVSALVSNVVEIGNDNAVFIPNTFTPNGDGINDVFVVSISNLSTYHIQIFNRYGQQLYNSTNMLNNWDGTYNSKPVPAGTYYYVINAKSMGGNALSKSGFVQVIR